MARITVEDCIDKFESRFELVLVASNRARKLHSGENPTVDKNNDKNTVIALREIADESIEIVTLKEDLIEEYQTVSSSDDEELSLEYSNLDNETSDEEIEENMTASDKLIDDNLDTEINQDSIEEESYVDNNDDNNSQNL